MPQDGQPEAGEGPEGAITTDPGFADLLPAFVKLCEDHLKAAGASDAESQ